MSWFRWFVVGLLAGLTALALLLWRGDSAGSELVNFAAQLDTATVRRPRDAVFSVTEITIAGESRRAIAMTEASRLAWDVAPLEGQTLEVEAGLREDGWSSEANAVLFRVGLSYDGQYEDLVARVINPALSADDRQWVPLRVDLSPYAGRSISLIFNTAAAPGAGVGHVHHAAWGAPRIVQR